MFGFKKQKAPATVQAPPTTVIAVDAAFEGTIVTKNTVIIEGHFEGTIDAGEILVREKASVKGNVKSTILINKGSITGPVTADRIVMKSTARIDGDVAYGRMVMQDGAFVSGRTSQITHSSAPETSIDDHKVVALNAR